MFSFRGRALFLIVFLIHWGSPLFSISVDEILEQNLPPERGTYLIKKDEKFCLGGRHELRLDMVRSAPRGTELERKPVIIFLHPDMMGGTRNGVALALAKRAADEGFVGVAIDYRLTGWPASDSNKDNDRLQVGAIFPDPILDVRCAIRWLRANAEGLFVHPGKIVIWGSGSAGYLAVMAGLTGSSQRFPSVGDLSSRARKQTNDLRAVINWFGLTSTNIQHWHDQRPKAVRIGLLEVQALLGGPLNKKRKLYESASPVHYIAKESAPILSFHGTRDPVYPFESAVRLHHSILEREGVHTLVPLPGMGHAFLGRKGDVRKDILKKVLQQSFEYAHVSIKEDPVSIVEEKKTREIAAEKKKKEDDWW